MSDQESGINPSHQEVESDVTAAFSSNGSTPDAGGDRGLGYDYSADDGGMFLDDLARAMRTTAAAEQARNSELTEQRRKAHLDAIRAREAIEAEELRELAKDDVKGIDTWSDGEIKRIKLERERRIAARREQLHVRLEEHRTVVAREVDAVEAAVKGYRTSIEQYFGRLELETDPVAIARIAGTRPAFPALELIGPGDRADAAPTGFRSQAWSPAVTAVAEEATEATYSVEENAPVEATDAVDTDAVEAVAVTDAVEATEAPEAVESPEIADAESTDEVVAVSADATAEDANDGMIGVMAAETEVESTDSAWAAGTEATAEASTPDADLVAAGNAGSRVSEASEEPVAAVAETRVIMPRSTSAGSWLRWPNNSVDRTDQTH